MRLMKRTKPFSVLLLLSMLFVICAAPVHADTGPKPSVRVEIEGLEDEIYYVTLLSQTESTGPATAYDGTNPDYQEGDRDYDIWKTFLDYKDADGFYFLQQFRYLEGDDTYVWGYYPPRTFKILFYFPEYDRFVTTNVHERYAFDSYFRVDFSHVNLQASVGEGAFILAEKSYDYGWETVSLVVRILITIALELGLALLFRYRGKKVLGFLAGVNITTQIALNMILNIVNFHYGALSFILYYIFVESIIFLLEAVAYAVFLPKLTSHEKRGKAILYAWVANTLSFVLGMGIAFLIPGIF